MEPQDVQNYMRLRWLHNTRRKRRGTWACLLGLAFGLLGQGCGPSDGEQVQAARVAYSQWDLQEAEAFLEPLFKSQPADSIALLYGEVLFAQRDLLRARKVLEPLAFAEEGSNLAALRHLAHTHFFLGSPDSSEVLARRLLREAQGRGDAVHQARAHHILGLVGFYRAAYDSASYHQVESLRLARKSGDSKAEADALRQLGVLAWYSGKNDEALKAYYQPALAIYQRINDKIGEATTLSNIGLIEQAKGHAETNLQYQLMAFGIRKQIGDQVGLADSYQFLATSPYVRHPDSRTARSGQTYSYLRKSAEISTRIGYSWGREVAVRALEMYFIDRFDEVQGEDIGQWVDSVETVSGEGLVYARHQQAVRAYADERWEDALALFRQQYVLNDSVGVPLGKFHTLHWQVVPLRKLQRWDELEQVLLEMQTLDFQYHRTSGGLAEFYMDTRQPERAEALLKPLAAHYDSLYLHNLFQSEPSLAFERAAGVVHLARTDFYLSLVRALVLQDKTQEAFTYIERERALPFWGERDQQDVPDRQAVSRFVQLLDAYEADPEQFDDVQTLLAAVSEMQQAMVAEQKMVTQTAPTSRALEVTSLSALQRVLRPGEVYVAYALGRTHDIFYPLIEKDALHVVAVRSDTVASFSIDIPPETLENLIDLHGRTLFRGRDKPEDTVWRGSSHKLYTTLLAPLVERGLLQQGDALILSPHRVLHRVPFHALTTTPKTQAPRFVIEDHVVSYVPSATFLVEARLRETMPFQSVLAVAPQGHSLPFSEVEINSIPEALFSDRKTMRNGEAQADRVLQELEHYDAIHLATHARMNQRFPLYSHIAFPDRRLELHEILRQDLQARLVVLSACETGRGVGLFGSDLSSEDLVSFPRAFLTAGAASVVASLWLVEDEATATLMEMFYHHISTSCTESSAFQLIAQATPTTCSLAEALARAQRQFLSEASDARSHPFYWAGFYLIGDGR